MRLVAFCTIIVILLTGAAMAQESGHDLRDGDILFQDFPTPQSMAIKLATQSEWTHCGLLFYVNDTPMVWEAVHPVKITALDQWVARSDSGYFEVKRLPGADTLLTKEVLKKMKEYGRAQMGKNYDIYFNWSDEEFYCSEFVWKMYFHGLGIELAKHRPLKDYDLSHPAVQAKMTERYGDSIPLEEPMVAPVDLYNAEGLEAVELD